MKIQEEKKNELDRQERLRLKHKQREDYEREKHREQVRLQMQSQEEERKQEVMHKLKMSEDKVEEVKRRNERELMLK